MYICIVLNLEQNVNEFRIHSAFSSHSLFTRKNNF